MFLRNLAESLYNDDHRRNNKNPYLNQDDPSKRLTETLYVLINDTEQMMKHQISYSDAKT
jgi:hypothetical protein